jgi:hypothetical protein
MLVLSGDAANNTVVVRASGPDAGRYSINHGQWHRFAGIRSLRIQGHGGHDVCTIVNQPHGLFAPPDGIVCDGGNKPGQPRRGVLAISGGHATSDSYSPGRVPGSGVDRGRLGRELQLIHFSGLAPTLDTVPSPHLTFTAAVSGPVLLSSPASGEWEVQPLSGTPFESLSVKLPRAVLAALSKGAKVSVALTLTATGSGRTGHAATRLTIAR